MECVALRHHQFAPMVKNAAPNEMEKPNHQPDTAGSTELAREGSKLVSNTTGYPTLAYSATLGNNPQQSLIAGNLPLTIERSDPLYGIVIPEYRRMFLLEHPDARPSDEDVIAWARVKYSPVPSLGSLIAENQAWSKEVLDTNKSVEHAKATSEKFANRDLRSVFGDSDSSSEGEESPVEIVKAHVKQQKPQTMDHFDKSLEIIRTDKDFVEGRPRSRPPPRRVFNSANISDEETRRPATREDRRLQKSQSKNTKRDAPPAKPSTPKLEGSHQGDLLPQMMYSEGIHAYWFDRYGVPRYTNAKRVNSRSVHVYDYDCKMHGKHVKFLSGYPTREELREMDRFAYRSLGEACAAYNEIRNGLQSAAEKKAYESMKSQPTPPRETTAKPKGKKEELIPEVKALYNYAKIIDPRVSGVAESAPITPSTRMVPPAPPSKGKEKVEEYEQEEPESKSDINTIPIYCSKQHLKAIVSAYPDYSFYKSERNIVDWCPYALSLTGIFVWTLVNGFLESYNRVVFHGTDVPPAIYEHPLLENLRFNVPIPQCDWVISCSCWGGCEECSPDMPVVRFFMKDCTTDDMVPFFREGDLIFSLQVCPAAAAGTYGDMNYELKPDGVEAECRKNAWLIRSVRSILDQSQVENRVWRPFSFDPLYVVYQAHSIPCKVPRTIYAHDDVLMRLISAKGYRHRVMRGAAFVNLSGDYIVINDQLFNEAYNWWTRKAVNPQHRAAVCQIIRAYARKIGIDSKTTRQQILMIATLSEQAVVEEYNSLEDYNADSTTENLRYNDSVERGVHRNSITGHILNILDPTKHSFKIWKQRIIVVLGIATVAYAVKSYFRETWARYQLARAVVEYKNTLEMVSDLVGKSGVVLKNTPKGQLPKLRIGRHIGWFRSTRWKVETTRPDDPELSVIEEGERKGYMAWHASVHSPDYTAKSNLTCRFFMPPIQCCAQKVGTHLWGIAFGNFRIVTAASCLCNEEKALVNRVFYTPGVCVKNIDQDFSTVPLPDSIPLDFQPWFDHLEPKQRELYYKYHEGSDFYSGIEKHKSFVKIETNVLRNDIAAFDPRLIQGSTPSSNWIAGPFVYNFMKTFERFVNREQDEFVCVYTMTPDDLGKAVDDRLKFPIEVAFSGDVQRMDASIHPTMNRFWRRVVRMYVNDEELIALYAGNSYLVGVTRFGIIYWVAQGIASGITWTAANHCLMVWCIWVLWTRTKRYLSFKNKGGQQMILDKSDDTNLTLGGRPYEKCVKYGTKFYKFSEQYGLVFETMITQHFEQSEFLAMFPYFRADGSCAWVPKIGRMLPKICWTAHPHRVQNHYKHAGSVALGMAHLSQVPVLGQLFSTILRIATERGVNIKKLKPINTIYEDYKYKMIGSTHHERDPLMAAIVLRYDVTTTDILSLEREIDNIGDIPSTVHHPVVDRFVEVDMGVSPALPSYPKGNLYDCLDNVTGWYADHSPWFFSLIMNVVECTDLYLMNTIRMLVAVSNGFCVSRNNLISTTCNRGNMYFNYGLLAAEPFTNASEHLYSMHAYPLLGIMLEEIYCYRDPFYAATLGVVEYRHSSNPKAFGLHGLFALIRGIPNLCVPGSGNLLCFVFHVLWNMVYAPFLEKHNLVLVKGCLPRLRKKARPPVPIIKKNHRTPAKTETHGNFSEDTKTFAPKPSAFTDKSAKMKRRDIRATKKLQSWLALGLIEECHIQWLESKLDIFHDGGFQPVGEPGLSPVKTLVQMLTYTCNIAFTGSNTDALIFFLPNTPDGNSTNGSNGLVGMTMLNGYASDNSSTLQLFGGWNCVVGPAGFTILANSITAGTVNTSTCALPQPIYSIGPTRVISTGVELTNTTAKLYACGAITAASIPCSFQPSYVYAGSPSISSKKILKSHTKGCKNCVDKLCPLGEKMAAEENQRKMDKKKDEERTSKDGKRLKAEVVSFVMPIKMAQLFPQQSNELSMYPGSLTWDAAKGIYMMARQNQPENRFYNGMPSNIGYYSQGAQGRMTMNGGLWGTSQIFNIAVGGPDDPWLFSQVDSLPFDVPIFRVSGQTTASTFQMTVRYIVETLTTQYSQQYTNLIHKSTPANALIFALYSYILEGLDVAVQVNQNAQGGWWDKILGLVEDFSTPAFTAIGGALGSAPAGAAFGKGVSLMAKSLKGEKFEPPKRGIISRTPLRREETPVVVVQRPKKKKTKVKTKVSKARTIDNARFAKMDKQKQKRRKKKGAKTTPQRSKSRPRVTQAATPRLTGRPGDRGMFPAYYSTGQMMSNPMKIRAAKQGRLVYDDSYLLRRRG